MSGAGAQRSRLITRAGRGCSNAARACRCLCPPPSSPGRRGPDDAGQRPIHSARELAAIAPAHLPTSETLHLSSSASMSTSRMSGCTSGCAAAAAVIAALRAGAACRAGLAAAGAAARGKVVGWDRIELGGEQGARGWGPRARPACMAKPARRRRVVCSSLPHQHPLLGVQPASPHQLQAACTRARWVCGEASMRSHCRRALAGSPPHPSAHGGRPDTDACAGGGNRA